MGTIPYTFTENNIELFRSLITTYYKDFKRNIIYKKSSLNLPHFKIKQQFEYISKISLKNIVLIFYLVIFFKNLK